MASLSDKKGIEKLVKYAKEIGLNYTPLKSDEIDALANEPFAYDPQTIVEDRAGNASGYYALYPSGWALIAIGPSLTGNPIAIRDFLAIPKGEGWATRSEVMRDANTDKLASGEITFNKANNGIVRLGKVLKVDKNGYPTSLMVRGIVVDAEDVEGSWQKSKDCEEADLWLYDNGRDRFKNLWTYKTQLMKRAGLLKRETQKAVIRGTDEETAKIREMEEDAAFLASVEKSRKSRQRKEPLKKK